MTLFGLSFICRVRVLVLCCCSSAQLGHVPTLLVYTRTGTVCCTSVVVVGSMLGLSLNTYTKQLVLEARSRVHQQLGIIVSARWRVCSPALRDGCCCGNMLKEPAVEGVQSHD